MTRMLCFDVSSIEMRILVAYLSGALSKVEVKPISFDERKVYEPPMPRETGRQRKSKGERKRDGWRFK